MAWWFKRNTLNHEDTKTQRSTKKLVNFGALVVQKKYTEPRRHEAHKGARINLVTLGALVPWW